MRRELDRLLELNCVLKRLQAHLGPTYGERAMATYEPAGHVVIRRGQESITLSEDAMNLLAAWWSGLMGPAQEAHR